MVSIPLNSTDADFFALIRHWIDLMSVNDFVGAMDLLKPHESGFWTSEQVKLCLQEYHQVRNTTDVFVTSFSQMQKDESRAEIYWFKERKSDNPFVASIDHDLALNGEWSDLTAQFDVWKTLDGYQVSLQDIHVLSNENAALF